MTSQDGISWTRRTAPEANFWRAVCWSPELGLFVAIADNGNNRVMTSPNGITWTSRSAPESNRWISVCWSRELGLFVAVGIASVSVVMTSNNGINWTARSIPGTNTYTWHGVCWSPKLGLFVAIAHGGNRVLISNNGINWSIVIVPFSNNNVWTGICWSEELGLFVAVAQSGTNLVMTSNDGLNWTQRSTVPNSAWYGVCWSPELGIFAAVSYSGASKVITSSLKGRPPTSYNVFDSSFNNIDETGKWTFLNLNVTSTFTNTSDDRLKHNEVVINNGLTIINQLCPKFYKKTLEILDTSHNGDLSGVSWNYESGLIAQDLLQISDISFVVSGGDYYQENYIYRIQTNDISNTNYDISNSNYDISYNLIRQTYNVNYNSIFIYGLAAIKELHQKVKAQGSFVNSLLSRIEALEKNTNY
jgi:hypothetical protein